MQIAQESKNKIIVILTNIFPKARIYYFGNRAKQHDSDGKQPEIDIAIDAGHKIGPKDTKAAQLALSETNIPYTIYLYDLNGVSEHERKNIIAKGIPWNK